MTGDEEIRATRGWRTREKFTKDFGTSWCRASRGWVLQVPSVVIPDESNYLINPSHPLWSEVKIVSIDPIDFDLRLWVRPDYL
jgi:RES domain-containing protein